MTREISNEAYIAGALLMDGEQVLKKIQSILSRDDFQSEAYGAIFSAALELSKEGRAIDPVSIQYSASREGVHLPGTFLVELMDCVPTTANCLEYAHRVAAEARTRRIKELAARISEDTISSPDELLETLHRETVEIREKASQRGLLSPAESLRRFNTYVAEAGEGKHSFVSTGFPRLDALLGGGFLRGGLYILGARPAVGKTTFCINLADNIQGNCLLVSLEMTPEQITSKRVSRLTGLSSAKLLSGKVCDTQWQGIAMASNALYGRGLYLNDRYDLTVRQIHLLARSVPQLQVVFIDYLGLIQPENPGGSSYENVTKISRELKRMAISLNVPVVCLCQLSRTVESRECKQPRLADLRDSGAIEQDADGVMLLYRQGDHSGSKTDDQPSMVQLYVAKNRHGKIGLTEFAFWLSTSTFKEVP